MRLLLNLVEFLLGGIERLLFFFGIGSEFGVVVIPLGWIAQTAGGVGKQSRSAQTKLALVEIQFMIQSIDFAFLLVHLLL